MKNVISYYIFFMKDIILIKNILFLYLIFRLFLKKIFILCLNPSRVTRPSTF